MCYFRWINKHFKIHAIEFQRKKKHERQFLFDDDDWAIFILVWYFWMLVCFRLFTTLHKWISLSKGYFAYVRHVYINRKMPTFRSEIYPKIENGFCVRVLIWCVLNTANECVFVWILFVLSFICFVWVKRERERTTAHQNHTSKVIETMQNGSIKFHAAYYFIHWSYKPYQLDTFFSIYLLSHSFSSRSFIFLWL